MNSSISVVIVDDHLACRFGFRSILEKDPSICLVDEIASGTSAIKIIPTIKPDIVLLDLYLEDMTGFTVMREIRKKVPHIKIIFITAMQDLSTLVRLFRKGANGVLLKNSTFSYSEMIHSVFAGKTYTQPDLYWLLNATHHVKNSANHLSDREFEILYLLLQEKTIQSIADSWQVSDRYIRTTKLKAFRKLGIRSLLELKGFFFGSYINHLTSSHAGNILTQKSVSLI